MTAAAAEKPGPQRQLAAAVVDVMAELGSSPQPEPPAAASRQAVAEPVVTTVTANDERLAEAAAREALVATNSPPAEPTAAVSATSEPTTFFTPPPATTATVIDGVTVGHATLEIPCGPGCDVPADWHFPTGPDPPNGVIWLQHGFLARARGTARPRRRSPNRPNSIVVPRRSPRSTALTASATPRAADSPSQGLAAVPDLRTQLHLEQLRLGHGQSIDARPGKFVGVELARGSHVDSMRGNAIIDFAAQLLTGLSPRGNFEAVETFATGWIKDMYDPDGHAGIYAEAGQTI